mgnify:CR=1 FL=1
MWERFLTENSGLMRMYRTIIQGVIGVIVANLDVLVGTFSIGSEFKPIIVAIVMAILAPIMAELGGKVNDN